MGYRFLVGEYVGIVDVIGAGGALASVGGDDSETIVGSGVLPGLVISIRSVGLRVRVGILVGGISPVLRLG